MLATSVRAGKNRGKNPMWPWAEVGKQKTKPPPGYKGEKRTRPKTAPGSKEKTLSSYPSPKSNAGKKP